MNQNYAVQIVEYVSEGRFRPKNAVIEAIFGDKRVKNLPLVVKCIAGAARKGKSFILNFFLSYFNHLEMNPNVPWQLDENTKLEGFEFQEGMKRTTVGIWAWNHIFVVKQSDGSEIAVCLVSENRGEQMGRVKFVRQKIC
uniref:GB1/RHD3-type G domain-containing protein n=1 Tax=Panagrolaimus sp. ES5 TaxID=591445 RepID=A0AC34FYA5_9BILA